MTKQAESKDKCPSIHWFRQDLRLADNPALSEAVAAGSPVYCLYIMCEQEEAPWAPGGASRVWLHFSLKALKDDLEAIGGHLHFFKCGKGETFISTKACLEAVIEETGAKSLYWNRRYEPAIIERDSHLKGHFKEKGLLVETSNSALLQEPWQMKTKEGKPFQVFTPYWKACLNQMDLDPPIKPPTLSKVVRSNSPAHVRSQI
jgi:Deoxyribodipyrimidine photolyase